MICNLDLSGEWGWGGGLHQSKVDHLFFGDYIALWCSSFISNQEAKIHTLPQVLSQKPVSCTYNVDLNGLTFRPKVDVWPDH